MKHAWPRGGHAHGDSMNIKQPSKSLSQNINQRRRTFMQAVSATGLSLAGAVRAATDSEPGDPWRQAQAIVDQLTPPPSFRDQDFPITAYGAVACELVTVDGWISFEERAALKTPAAGATDCYHAIAAAIAACHQAGGGRVLIPAGNWYCAGPIVLLSNVHVHLKAGAQIFFSNNPGDYAKYGSFDCGKNGKLVLARWQSNDCLNYSSMIYAYGQDNIALTGEDWSSVLNGQGGVPFAGSNDCWWTWKGKIHTIGAVAQGSSPNYVEGRQSESMANPLNPTSLAAIAPNLSEAQRRLIQGEGDRWRGDFGYLPALSEAGVPMDKRIFGLGHYLRPPMVQLIGCTNVLLQDYQTVGTPFWQHNPVNCRNLVIRHVHANSLGPNNDGFDPESCNYVLVDSCTFNTGDDCIAIKAGKDLDTQYGPTQNIVIQHCTMQSGHGGVTLGSEMSAGIQNVFAQNLVFENINWATNPLNTAIRLKTNMNRGGYLRNFYVRNIKIPNGVQTSPSFYKALPDSPIRPKTVASAAGAIVTFDCDYQPLNDNVRTRPPAVSNVHISQVTVGNVATKAGNYSCYQAILIQGPVASDYNGAEQPPPVVLPVSNVTISDCNFGTPVNAEHPYYVYNAQGVQLRNVTIADKLYNATLSA
jgi:polygalacturonase